LHQYLAQCGGGPDDFLEHRCAIEVFAQRQVFVAHPLFALLALVDVRARRIPAQEASLVIPQRVVPVEKPAILPAVPQAGSVRIQHQA
jgi:hypothetical protein